MDTLTLWYFRVRFPDRDTTRTSLTHQHSGTMLFHNAALLVKTRPAVESKSAFLTMSLTYK